ncbi:MAG: hypothetical protein KGI97_05165 [Alphaproteobacteria bacterium]|nr:hypothetical protein [Alphaproteobacteria bacterium]
MTDLRPHRVWIGLLLLALVITVAQAPLLDAAQRKAAVRLDMLRAQAQKAEDGLRQFRADIALTKRLKDRISAKEAERSLAPIDRLHAAKILERRAAETHLSDFAYTLSPEKNTVIDSSGAGKQTLAASHLSLSAKAPADTDAYLFLDDLRRTLPGRLTLQKISLKRIHSPGAPVRAENLIFKAEGIWLSNGAPKLFAANNARGRP